MAFAIRNRYDLPLMDFPIGFADLAVGRYEAFAGSVTCFLVGGCKIEVGYFV